MDLSAHWIDTVTYSTGLTFVDGTMTPSDTTTAIGRLEEEFKIITLAGGQERTGTHRFASETGIPLQALVWLPDADTDDQGQALIVLGRRYAKLLGGEYSFYEHTLGR